MRGTKRISKADIDAFRRTVRSFYRHHARRLPWRETSDPYRILVSEIMLQQTQVERVLPKYRQFVRRFPTFEALHRTKPAEVLRIWSGLGYNRRALALKSVASSVVVHFGGKLPSKAEILSGLPGIGPYTAAALQALIWSRPVPLIETNIRTVYLHAFFPGRKGKVDDEELLDLVAATLPRVKIREWYYGLMDYGTWLKRQGVRLNERSAQYRKQGVFAGSRRELRGEILRLLLEKRKMTVRELVTETGKGKEIVENILASFEKEGMVVARRGGWTCE